MNGGFSCDSDHDICIPSDWSCLGGDLYVWDCPNQNDVSQETCKNVTVYIIADCENNSIFFQCTNTNNRCIYLFQLCDGYYDCLDGQDESSSICSSVGNLTASTVGAFDTTVTSGVPGDESTTTSTSTGTSSVFASTIRETTSAVSTYYSTSTRLSSTFNSGTTGHTTSMGM